MSKKIAVVVLRNDPLDGRLRRQISALETEGYSVSIFPLFSGTGRATKSSKIRRILQLAIFKLTSSYIRLQIFRLRPNLILAHEPEALSVVGPLVRTENLPLIYDAHEFYEAQRGADPARIAWLRKTHDRNAEVVTGMMTVSPGLVELYQKRHPRLPKATLVCNAAVKPSDLTYDGRLHQAVGLTNDIKILLYHGGMWAGRGIEQVVKASSILPQGWVTVLMGYGPLLEHVTPNARLHVIPPVPQKDLLFWLSGASLGIIPYPDNNLNHHYCMPNKLWEIPLAGVPVISRDLPNIRSFIDKHEIGVLFPRSGDEKYISNIIENLSAADLNKFCNSCQDFSKTEIWEKYEKSFLDLVAHCASETAS